MFISNQCTNFSASFTLTYFFRAIDYIILFKDLLYFNLRLLNMLLSVIMVKQADQGRFKVRIPNFDLKIVQTFLPAYSDGNLMQPIAVFTNHQFEISYEIHTSKFLGDRVHKTAILQVVCCVVRINEIRFDKHS